MTRLKHILSYPLPVAFQLDFFVTVVLPTYVGSILGTELAIWMQTGSWVALTDMDLLMCCAIWTLPLSIFMVYSAFMAIYFYKEWLFELEAGVWGRNWEPTEDIEQPLLGGGKG